MKSFVPLLFLHYLYIFSLLLKVRSMETVCRVLLGKAETKGNGCGQTVVLEREGGKHEEDRRAGEGEKMEKYFEFEFE